MEIYLIMLNNVQTGNKYVKMDSEIGKGVQALKHPLPGSEPAAKKLTFWSVMKSITQIFNYSRIFQM